MKIQIHIGFIIVRIIIGVTIVKINNLIVPILLNDGYGKGFDMTIVSGENDEIVIMGLTELDSFVFSLQLSLYEGSLV